MKELDIFKKYYSDSKAFAKEAQAEGKKLVGYVCNCVPEEFIIAAGFLPVRIPAAPGNDIKSAVAGMSKMGPSEAYSVSMAASIIDGDYSFLDHLVVPHARGSVHKMYSVLRDKKKEDPSAPIPETYFLDHTHSMHMSSFDYDRARMLEFKEELEKWSGKPISDEALTDAVTLCNETRSLLKEFQQLRKEAKISGADALCVIGASMFMDKKVYNPLLKSLNEQLAGAEALPGKRVFFTGAPQDNTQLYELIESCGCVVTADDNCWGNRASDTPVELIHDVTEDVIYRYDHKTPCPHIGTLANRAEVFGRTIAGSDAEAAIFFTIRFDPNAWNVPEQMKKAEELGIPTLYLTKQKYPVGDPEEVKTAVTAFLSGEEA
ncbi:MAG: 2-hydroxyacyl-CoA dehydratase [Firmicutes bacterium]|nr:2-hydroxyacyl-CoA dehydratase [Bacillota bacterium]